MRRFVSTQGVRRAALPLCVLWLLWSCEDSKAKPGGLVVMIESDLAIPKDIDRIVLEIRQGTDVLRTEDHQLGEDQLLIPAEFRLPPIGNSDPVTIRGTAFKRDQSRIERTAITPVPVGHHGLVRLPFNYLCTGFVDAAGASSCGAGRTCNQGTCIDAAIPRAQLPRYEGDLETTSSGIRSSGAGDGARNADGTGLLSTLAQGDQCFDVLNCFDDFRVIDTPGPDCTLSLPDGSDPDSLNIALALPPGREGVCNVEGCWVALARGQDGWSIDGDQITLPGSICTDRPDGVPYAIALSSSCMAKSPDTPVCGKWSSATVPLSSDSATDLPPAAIGQSCAGRPSESCGVCGSRTRRCRNGSWEPWSQCSSEGECTSGQTEACGTDGTRTCNLSCHWDQCAGQSCGDEPTRRACGHCGSQTRTCDNGTWGPWSDCTNEGQCAPDDVQACGSGGNQVCGGNCAWGECTQQMCPGAASQACGRCGTRSRTCDAASGQWSEWSACAGEGECDPDSTQACGHGGRQACGGDCHWDAQCSGQSCDGPQMQACGRCGMQARRCDASSGQQSEWSACANEGMCAPGQTRACGGGNGLQSCGADCRWDDCVTVCKGPFTRACGNCGTQTRGCDLMARSEAAWSRCSGEGACAPGAPRSCGTDGGSQTCGLDCQWPARCECPADAPLSRPCMCGEQTRTCTLGGLSEWSACRPGGVCTPGMVRACGATGSGRTQTCSDGCAWGECAADCSGVALTQRCGNCGTQTRSCDPAAGMSGWGPCTGEGCAPGSKQSCADLGFSAHSQTCNDTCEWGMCECPDSLTACAYGCVDLTSDVGNCGSCFTYCLGEEKCVGGNCVCTSPYTACPPNDFCVDTRSDVQNCGGCGLRCSEGICKNSSCVCPPGATLCGGVNCCHSSHGCMADGSCPVD